MYSWLDSQNQTYILWDVLKIVICAHRKYCFTNCHILKGWGAEKAKQHEWWHYRPSCSYSPTRVPIQGLGLESRPSRKDGGRHPCADSLVWVQLRWTLAQSAGRAGASGWCSYCWFEGLMWVLGASIWRFNAMVKVDMTWPWWSDIPPKCQKFSLASSAKENDKCTKGWFGSFLR